MRRLATAGARCAAMSDRLAALMDRDSEAYDRSSPPSACRRAQTKRRRRERSAIQEALRAATEAPLDVMHACADAIRAGGRVADSATQRASDVQVGLELLAPACAAQAERRDQPDEPEGRGLRRGRCEEDAAAGAGRQAGRTARDCALARAGLASVEGSCLDSNWRT